MEISLFFSAAIIFSVIYVLIKSVCSVTPPADTVLLIKNTKGAQRLSYNKCIINPLDETYRIINLKPVVLSYAFCLYQGIYFKDMLKGDVKISFTVKLKNTKENIIQAATTFNDAALSSTSSLGMYFKDRVNGVVQETAKQFHLASITAGVQQSKDLFQKQIFKSIQNKFDNFELLGLKVEDVKITDRKFLNPGNVLDAQSLGALSRLKLESDSNDPPQNKKQVIISPDKPQLKEQQRINHTEIDIEQKKEEAEQKLSKLSGLDEDLEELQLQPQTKQDEPCDIETDAKQNQVSSNDQNDGLPQQTQQKNENQPDNIECENQNESCKQATVVIKDLSEEKSGAELIGQPVVVRSHIVSLTYGEAYLNQTIPHKTIAARIKGNERLPLSSGDHAVIIDYDPAYNIYFIVKDEEYLGQTLHSNV